jgi:hypothetical protein
MRVPSSSLTLRSEAPVRTRRGSGFVPLISRAVRGCAWAAPSFAFAAVEGSGRASPRGAWLVAQRGMGACGARFTSSRPRATLSRTCPLERVDIVSSQGLAPLEGFTWHGYPRCLLYVKQAPGGLLTSMSLRGLTSFRAVGSCRSRVLRGMGARDACFTSSRSRAAFSRRCTFEGCYRLEPRARAAQGFYVAWVPAVPALHQAGPVRPSHADIPSRVAIVWSQGLVPLEGFAWLGCPRCLLYIKQVPGGLLTPISHRGLSLSRARGSPRSRVLLAWQGTGSLNASQSRLRFCNVGVPF